MARRARIDPEDGWHHVMNRGADHQVIFTTRNDAERFLFSVSESVELSGVAVHAYCLMTNHYHLLAHCPDGGLSRFMKHLGASYTQAINAKYGRDGALFRGRFHSVLITEPTQLGVVERYIHRNPLAIRPDLPLDTFRWSSLRYYVRGEAAPPWLNTALFADAYSSRQAHLDAVEQREISLDARPVAASEAASRTRWAVATAIEEACERIDRSSNIARTIVHLMTEVPGAPTRVIDDWLGFTDLRAADTARVRALQRAAAQPVLRSIAQRAVYLAA